MTKPLSFAGDSGTNVARTLGSTLNIKGGKDASGVSNIATKANGGDTLEVIMTDSPTFKQTTVGSVITSSATNDITGLSNTTLSAADYATKGRAATEEQLKLVNTTATKGWDVSTAKTGTGTVSGTSVANVAPGAKVTTTAGNNIAIIQSGTDLTIATNPDLVATSITTGDSKLDTSGLSITAGPSITKTGIDAASKKITNVTAGTAGTDAVNVAQVTTLTGGNVSYNADGSLKSGFEVGGTKYGTIAQAIEGAAANVELKFDGNDSSAGVVSRKSGQTLSIVGAATTTGSYSGANLKTVTDPTTGKIQLQLADNPVLTTVTTGNSKLDTTGLTITGGPNVTTVGIDAANMKVSNVSPGAITTASTDAINGSQLYSSANSVVTALGGTSTLNPDGSVKAGFSVGGSSYTNVQDALKVVGNSVSGVESLIGSANGPASPDFLTYSVNGRATQDRQNLLQTVQTMNSKGIKYVHTNSSDAGTGTNPDSTDDSSASGANSSAFGVKATTTAAASNAVSMGYKSTAGGVSSVAIGDGAQALGTQSISIGTGNVVKGDHSGAIGDPTIIDAANSYSVGNTNVIGVGLSDVFVLGNNVTATQSNSVILGSKSADKAPETITQATVNLTQKVLNADGSITSTLSPYTFGGFAGTAIGVVSVGSAGAERQIVNVAPGRITATSTDAVNGSQLYSVATGLSSNISTLSSSLNHFISVNGNKTDANYANNGATGAGSMALGVAASSTNANATAVGNGATATGAASVAMGSGAHAGLANTVAIGANAVANVNAGDIALGSGSATAAVVATPSGVVNGSSYSYAGTAPTSTLSVGSAGNERTITNVAAGQVSAVSTDAINGSQLNATNQAVAWTGQAIAATNQALAVTNQAVTALETGATGLVRYSNAATPTAPNGGIRTQNMTLVGANSGPVTLSNVAAGTLSATSTDAVNGSQLYATNQDVKIALAGHNITAAATGTGVANGAQLVAIVPKSTLTYTAGDNMVLTQKGAELQFAVNANPNFDSLTAQNITANGTTTLGGAVNVTPNTTVNMGNNQITNVAPGIANADAVNMGQLQAVNTALTQNINQVAKIAYAGVAAAIAMESAPYVAGKLTYAAGVGHFEGQSALGVSLRRTAESGRWSISGGISSSPIRGTAVRAGISGVFD